jgi:hypothetical protein
MAGAPIDVEIQRRTRARLEESMTTNEFADSWALGAELSVEEAAPTLARRVGDQHRRQSPPRHRRRGGRQRCRSGWCRWPVGANYLGWPKSTTSVLVKDLERRGWLARARRDDDERRLAIELTEEGRARVASDRILDSRRLTAALRALSPVAREQLLNGLDQLAGAAERLPADGSGPAR